MLAMPEADLPSVRCVESGTAAAVPHVCGTEAVGWRSWMGGCLKLERGGCVERLLVYLFGDGCWPSLAALGVLINWDYHFLWTLIVGESFSFNLGWS